MKQENIIARLDIKTLQMVIAIDFDGTIVEHRYPEIGKVIPNSFKVLKKLKGDGHILILWTYRCGEELNKAVKFCKKNGIEFHAVNNNFDDEIFDTTYSRKIYADIYIDDRNILGIPDWDNIYEIVRKIADEVAKDTNPLVNLEKAE